jgi:hypothetical protein
MNWDGNGNIDDFIYTQERNAEMGRKFLGIPEEETPIKNENEMEQSK